MYSLEEPLLKKSECSSWCNDGDGWDDSDCDGFALLARLKFGKLLLDSLLMALFYALLHPSYELGCMLLFAIQHSQPAANASSRTAAFSKKKLGGGKKREDLGGKIEGSSHYL